jgi:hypothetical protein
VFFDVFAYTIRVIDVFRQIYRTEGVRGWYRGLGGTILRDLPSSAIWWGVYEVTKSKMHALGLGGKKMLANHNVEDESPVIHIVAGTVAGLVATTLCNPMDVAKTRLQAVDILPSQTSDPTARQTAWKRLFR